VWWPHRKQRWRASYGEDGHTRALPAGGRGPLGPRGGRAWSVPPAWLHVPLPRYFLFQGRPLFVCVCDRAGSAEYFSGRCARWGSYSKPHEEINFLRGKAQLVRRSSRRGWSREKRDHEAEKPMTSE
jgi:hypothetical protein